MVIRLVIYACLIMLDQCKLMVDAWVAYDYCCEGLGKYLMPIPTEEVIFGGKNVFVKWSYL